MAAASVPLVNAPASESPTTMLPFVASTSTSPPETTVESVMKDRVSPTRVLTANDAPTPTFAPVDRLPATPAMMDQSVADTDTSPPAVTELSQM